MSSILKVSNKLNKFGISITQARFPHTQTLPKHIPSTRTLVPIFRKAIDFHDKIALRDVVSKYTYGSLFIAAKELSNEITKNLDNKTNNQVLYLCPNDANYVVTQWAIWMSGQVAVPVSPLHPQTMLEYFANDCNGKLLITTVNYAEIMHKVAKNCNKKLIVLDEQLQENTANKLVEQTNLEGGQPDDFYRDNNCMILYTSGTTGNPKGVVLTHRNVSTQVTTLIDAWKWTSDDVILHTLPLHHVHGIINAYLCPLYVGAKCNMLQKFDSNTVWSHLLGVNMNIDDRKITVFMAVPTIYANLINEYERVFSKDSKITEYIKSTLKTKVRLMVSGSAPLPTPIYEKWLDITGHKLLERYGMTEIGMCLSQLYNSQREPGYVGIPLPGYSIRLCSKDQNTSNLECSNINNKVEIKQDESGDVIGELLVKGDAIFKEYYNKPDITKNEFTNDGWFKTGDLCQYVAKKKLFKMLGRTSVDIIKTGGYKVSALEIETKLLAHPDIIDCAVVGIDDEKWGEIVAAVVVLKTGSLLTIENLRTWAKNSMTSYSIPKVLNIVESIPKNVMGKINKKELKIKLFST